jgi:hypothetical protein
VINQNVNDTWSLVEALAVPFTQLGTLYLNYLKVCAYKDAPITSLKRPFNNNRLIDYNTNIFKQNLSISLKPGKYKILLYPDVVITPEFCSLFEKPQQVRVSCAYIYDVTQKSVNIIYQKPIEDKSIEYYKLISSFIELEKPESTRSAFIKASFIPLITDQPDRYASDIRALEFFSTLDTLNIDYKEILSTKTFRYITPLKSTDSIGIVDSQPCVTPGMTKSQVISKIEGDLYTSLSITDLVKKYSMSPQQLINLLAVYHRSNTEQFYIKRKLPCLLIDITTQGNTINLSNTFEGFTFVGGPQVLMDLNKSDLDVVNKIIYLLRICYYLSLEEMTRMFFYPTNVDMHITKASDRAFIKELIGDPKDLKNNKYFSIIMSLWTYQKENTML